MAQEAVDVCLRVLKESNKRSFDSYSVSNSVLIISHITFRDCRVHIFADNLSRNSCMLCYSLAERSVLGETMPSGYTQDLGHNTDRPKPVNNIFIFFLLKFEIFWEILLQPPP